MSSILKALQRLQGDRGGAASPEPQPALRDDLAREVTGSPAAGASPADPGATRLRLAVIGAGAGAALLVVAATGWWLARETRGAEPEAPMATAATDAAAPAPTPPAAAARPVEPAPSPQAAAAPVAAGGPEAPAPAAEAPRVAPAPTPPPPLARARVREPRARDAARFEIAAEEKAAAPSPPARPKPEPPARATPTPAAPAQPKPAREAPAPAAPKAKPPARAAVAPAPPAVEVLRTIWHPRPDRRVARLRVEGRAAPLDVREGDGVATLVVKTIEPSGVRFLYGAQEIRRAVGERP